MGARLSAVTRSSPFVHPISVRYLEVDQQRVVFNMWYLAYVDDAMTAFLLEGGLPYSQMMARGCDVQLVHAQLDWKGSLTWDSRATVGVGLTSIGRTSFTLDFDFRSLDRTVATAHCVYVAIHTDGSGKRDVPTYLVEALGVVGPLRT
jgi:acyl-CoA thioester hydrolase